MKKKINKLIRTSRHLLQQLGREPSPEEIAKEMEISVEKVFDNYETKKKEIAGYRLKTTPENAEGQITENPIEVVYVYEVYEPIYTGDTSNFTWYVAGLIAVSIVIISLVVIKIKKNKQN